ncbi:DNA polymerase III subunit delta [Legionella sp.]|uniref:DNA polymerase III subunit delta n=1 Tax=Legionella sp. TaxID=459 RepID=UPI003C8B078B
MQIKQQAVAQHVQRTIAPLYLLIGQDNYLLDESLITIKSAIKKAHDCDERIIAIQTTEDWNNVRDEANSYSLFSDIVLLTIFFEKKSIDVAGKKILTEYLNSINSRCFIVIRAPNVPIKQVQWLTLHEQAVVLVAFPLNQASMKNWITTELSKQAIGYDPQVPDIIYHYTQGNMLACAQVIEKIALSTPSKSKINVQQAQEHLSNQCDHNLFELVEACLKGQSDKVIQILRHAASTKIETTLILWMLTQEIRTILQFTNLLQQKIDIKKASAQLKIWPQRISLYQESANRLSTQVLKQLHQYCYSIDERIKSSLSTQIWSSLENLALSLCLGQLIGDTWTV